MPLSGRRATGMRPGKQDADLGEAQQVSEELGARGRGPPEVRRTLSSPSARMMSDPQATAARPRCRPQPTVATTGDAALITAPVIQAGSNRTAQPAVLRAFSAPISRNP
jgi:hypothetical protein